MIRFVIDASAAVEYLLRTPLGRKLDDLIADAFLLAPELLDIEVLSALRRALLQERIQEHRARLALEDLGDWPVDRVSHSLLLRDVWKHRHNLSAYDAFYVAVARLTRHRSSPRTGPCPELPAWESWCRTFV